MKLTGSYLRRSQNESGNLELVFEINGYGSKREAEKLEKKDYILNISEIKSARSIRQNDMLWGVIKEIELKTGVNGWDIYCQLLQMANAKFEYMLILPDAMTRTDESDSRYESNTNH